MSSLGQEPTFKEKHLYHAEQVLSYKSWPNLEKQQNEMESFSLVEQCYSHKTELYQKTWNMRTHTSEHQKLSISWVVIWSHTEHNQS